MDITHITSLLGGIALFLYGMSIMGAGLEKLAGGKMQGVLRDSGHRKTPRISPGRFRGTSLSPVDLKKF